MNPNVHALNLNPNHPHSQELVTTHILPRLADDSLLLQAAEVVKAPNLEKSRILVQSNSHGIAADRFRMLRFGLRPLWASGKLRTLIVTSALPREGKSTIALNLAAGLAEHGNHSVALVEADFRHPSLLERLEIPPRSGLVKAIKEGDDPFYSICRVDPLGFYLLPAGEATANPIDLLNSDPFSRTIARLRASLDWVIIDCPPVGPIPDLHAIKSKADGCLWVVRADSTSRDVVDEAIQQVGRELIVGMVLNGADIQGHAYNDYYGPEPHRLSPSKPLSL